MRLLWVQNETFLRPWLDSLSLVENTLFLHQVFDIEAVKILLILLNAEGLPFSGNVSLPIGNVRYRVKVDSDRVVHVPPRHGSAHGRKTLLFWWLVDVLGTRRTPG